MIITSTLIATAAIVTIGYQGLSCAVNALLPPKNPRSVFGWFYRFIVPFTANLGRQLEQEYHVDLGVSSQADKSNTPNPQ